MLSQPGMDIPPGPDCKAALGNQAAQLKLQRGWQGEDVPMCLASSCASSQLEGIQWSLEQGGQPLQLLVEVDGEGIKPVVLL